MVLSFLLAVVMVVFVQPVGVLDFVSGSGALSPLALVALMTVGGYATVALSRMLLLIVGSRVHLPFHALAVWMSVELILCVAVASLMAWSIGGGGAVRLAPLAGDILLGNIAVFLMPNVIAFQWFRLRETRAELVSLRRKLTTGAAPAADQSINFYDKGGRLSFSTRLQNVLYIEAADNYANIHYVNGDKEDTFILHNSLKDIEKEFSGMGLMRCHRGYMVNVSNVKLMRKEKGGLVLELAVAAKTIPVSKSYSSAVTAHFSSEGTQEISAV
ncbi:MAG: LytTR family transcriptional regulator [Bacteroidales bacterium]|nr:LytTR family transcriptional regulator [Bacteroidales bacterium]